MNHQAMPQSKQLTIVGNYCDGVSSQRHAVTLRVVGDHIEWQGCELATCSLAQLRISGRVGRSSRFIYLANGATFETLDNDGCDELAKLASPSLFTGLAHVLESKKRYILFSVAFTLGFFAAVIFWGIPAASFTIAKNLPAEFSSRLGDGAMKSLDKEYFKPSALSAERKAEILGLFNSAVPALAEGYQFKLHIRQGGDLGANAFALPNGDVVITDELIELATHDTQILSVIYHEIGHVLHRHSLRRVIEASGAALTMAWMLGDVELATDWVSLVPIVLLGSMYSRDHEREADGYALQMLKDQGYSPEHFALMLEALMDSHEKDKNCTPAAANKNASDVESPDVVAQPQDSSIAAEHDDTKVASESGQHKKEPCQQERSWLRFLASHPATAERVARFRQTDAKKSE